MQVGERKEGEEVNLGTWIQARWKRMPSSICAAEEPSEDGASVQQLVTFVWPSIMDDFLLAKVLERSVWLAFPVLCSISCL